MVSYYGNHLSLQFDVGAAPDPMALQISNLFASSPVLCWWTRMMLRGEQSMETK
jgi:hypothetical protein